MRLPIRILVTVAAMVGTSFAAAIVLAVFNLYLTGQGNDSLMETRFSYPPLGVALGWGDIMLLACVLIAGLAAWFGSGRA